MTHRRPFPRRARRLVALCGVAAIAVAGLSACEPTGDADSTVTIDGRGWGHGRGMGQYGALGHAVDHGWSYRQILDHYYGGTTHGSAANPLLSVRLSQFDTAATPTGVDYAETTVTGPGTLRIADATGAVRLQAAGAVRVVRTGSSRFDVYEGPGCAGPWVQRATLASSQARVLPPDGSPDTVSGNLGICEPVGGTRVVRGYVRAQEAGGRHITVNVLHLDEYLRGVVPRESPAGWGDLGGGRGMHALRAQAVAARSYALADHRGATHTCDTHACQVYGGRFSVTGSTVRTLTDARTDRAVSETTGEVRVRNGSPVRAEFSSSTGGHTAGGLFPAVVDIGDATGLNPNHTWTTTTTMKALATRLNVPGLNGIKVTRRDGHGADGGRVLEVRLDHPGGSRTVSGEQFRAAAGLKSAWFTFSFS
jgi:SpoIID/LytB domain protein